MSRFGSKEWREKIADSWNDPEVRHQRTSPFAVRVARPGSDEFEWFPSTFQAYKELRIPKPGSHQRIRKLVRRNGEAEYMGFRFLKA